MEIFGCAGILDEEKSTAAVFQPVPFHYLEIAKVLFAEAKDCFGADMLKVYPMVLSIFCRLLYREKGN